MTGHDATDRATAWRRARRDVGRRLHPDLGGDVSAYLAAIGEVDRRFADVAGPSGARPGPAATAPGSARPVRGGARRSRRVIRALRAHLPRGVPGARRYFQL